MGLKDIKNFETRRRLEIMVWGADMIMEHCGGEPQADECVEQLNCRIEYILDQRAWQRGFSAKLGPVELNFSVERY
jgi:hypothetical protein